MDTCFFLGLFMVNPESFLDLVKGCLNVGQELKLFQEGLRLTGTQ